MFGRRRPLLIQKRSRNKLTPTGYDKARRITANIAAPPKLLPKAEQRYCSPAVLRITRGMTFKMRMEAPMRLLRKPLPLFNYPHSGGVSRAAKGADCKAA